MAWGSTAAANTDLAAWYGASKTIGPDTLEISLWDGNPTDGDSVEVTDDETLPRVTVNNDGTTWPNAPANGSITSASIDVGPSLAAMTGIGQWWAIHDGDTGDLLDVGRLSDAVDFVDVANYVVRITGLTVSCPVG